MIAAVRCGHQVGASPGSVGVPKVPFMVQPNYLGIGARGFDAGDPSTPNYAPANLSRNASLTVERLAGRYTLKAEFDRLRSQLDRSPRCTRRRWIFSPDTMLLVPSTSTKRTHVIEIGMAATSGGNGAYWHDAWSKPELSSSRWIGDGTSTKRTIPVAVGGGLTSGVTAVSGGFSPNLSVKNVLSVKAGGTTSYALTADHRLFSWG